MLTKIEPMMGDKVHTCNTLNKHLAFVAHAQLAYSTVSVIRTFRLHTHMLTLADNEIEVKWTLVDT